MRRLRDWRLFAAALGLAVVMANPTWGLSHALAHHHDDQQSHQHLRSLDSHDGPSEWSAGGPAEGHQHGRIDQATRTAPHHLFIGPANTTAVAVLDLVLNEGSGTVPGPSIEVPDPPGNEPPKLRAPPLS